MKRSLQLSEYLLRNGYKVRILTHGSSMFPVIGTGDQITISPDKDPAIGDMIVFKKKGGMVCHRLVKKFEKEGAIFFQSRGDSLWSLDNPISRDEILGKVTRVDIKNCSITRKALLLIFPLLHRTINTAIVSGLIKIKRVLS